jgi:antirestriction protein ArdC
MTKKTTNRKSAPRQDLFQTVTDKIITALENGTTPWRKAWQTGKEGCLLMPLLVGTTVALT